MTTLTAVIFFIISIPLLPLIYVLAMSQYTVFMVEKGLWEIENKERYENLKKLVFFKNKNKTS